MQNHLALNTYVHGYFGYDQISRTLWRGPHILWTFWTGPNVLQSIWLADIRLFWTGPNNRQDIREIGSLASVPQRRVRGCLAEPHPFHPWMQPQETASWSVNTVFLTETPWGEHSPSGTGAHPWASSLKVPTLSPPGRMNNDHTLGFHGLQCYL